MYTLMGPGLGWVKLWLYRDGCVWILREERGGRGGYKAGRCRKAHGGGAVSCLWGCAERI